MDRKVLDDHKEYLREQGFYLPYSKPHNNDKNTKSNLQHIAQPIQAKDISIEKNQKSKKLTYQKKLLTRPIFHGTSAWDWVSLVFTPIIGIGVSAYIAINLFSREIDANRKNLENQRTQNMEINEIILRETREQNSYMLYRQQMQDLILNHGLKKETQYKKNTSSREILLAKALTSSVFRELGDYRNRELVTFLYMSNLIQVGTTAILSDNFLASTNLESAYLVNADLTRTNMSNVNFKGADLTRAQLSYSDLRKAKLDRVNFSFADLKNANLENASLSYAKLIGANLSNSNLVSIDLTGADFDGANLEGAILEYITVGGEVNFFNSRGFHNVVWHGDKISTDEKKDLEPSIILSKGLEMAMSGNIEGSINAFNKVKNADPKKEISVFSWNTLCWFGSINGKAREVIFACENALESIDNSTNLSSDYKSKATMMAKDSRGVARGIIGDFSGAISDLKEGLDNLPNNLRNRREKWINALERGDNPFSPNELNYLRESEGSDFHS